MTPGAGGRGEAPIRIAVVTFPGSNDDRDSMRALRLLGAEPVPVWHADRDLDGADGVILPGGFSYGDYLRTGAIARFSPAMSAVREFAEAAGPVLGICNGFQILCEAGLLPGALIRNRGVTFICRRVYLRSEDPSDRPSGRSVPEVVEMPIKHGEGQFVASAQELDRIEAAGLVAYRYCSGTGSVDEHYNPNGSMNGIAGLRNERGNVVGLMPHPEHAVDPDVGPTGGHHVFQWLLGAARARVAASAGVLA